MSTEFTTKNLVSLFVPLLIGIIMIISGIIFLISDSNYRWFIAILFFVLGGFVLVKVSMDFNTRMRGGKTIKLDERLMTNQLKASDRSFRLLIALLLVLILLNSLKIIPDMAVVALVGPICAFAMVLYYFNFYRYDRRG